MKYLLEKNNSWDFDFNLAHGLFLRREGSLWKPLFDSSICDKYFFLCKNQLITLCKPKRKPIESKPGAAFPLGHFGIAFCLTSGAF